MEWRDAVLEALQRCSKHYNSPQITRKMLLDEELINIVNATHSDGATPEQTLSRVLQDLRDEGMLYFIDRGTYLLLDKPIQIENKYLPENAIDSILDLNKLRIATVEASDTFALSRQRKGQSKIRDWTLKNYGNQCALCDVSDNSLLVASHISRWSDDVESRGDLSNVICLCKFHDALFEFGFLSFSNDLKVLKKTNIKSQTINLNLDSAKEFRKPFKFSPNPKYLQKHRNRTCFD